MPIRHPALLPSLRTITVLALASLLLGGCSWFHRNKDRTDYENARQSRPLEVPPDLDSPAGSTALTIPSASGPTVGVREGDTLVLGRPADSSVAPPTDVGGAPVASGSNSLSVADNAASTWRRVGLAMERMDGTSIQSRDESAMSYSVSTVGQTVEKAGWFKRTITFGKAKKTVDNPVTLTIRVHGDGDTSTVEVEGGSSAADNAAIRSMIANLRARLT